MIYKKIELYAELYADCMIWLMNTFCYCKSVMCDSAYLCGECIHIAAFLESHWWWFFERERRCWYSYFIRWIFLINFFFLTYISHYWMYTGVLEANFIEPTHDKQDFERSTLFVRLESKLKQMTLEYWFVSYM